MQRLPRFLRRPSRVEGEASRLANISHSLLLLFICAAAMYMAAMLFLLDFSLLSLTRIAIPLVWGGLFIGIKLILWQGQVKTAARLLAGVVWIAMLLIGLLYGTNSALSTIGLLFALVINSLLLDVREMVALIIASIISLALIGLEQVAGIRAPLGLDDPAINLTQNLIFLTIAGIAIIFNMQTLKQTLGAVKRSEARFRAIFYNSLDAQFLGDTTGRIFAANPAACQLFGYTEAEFIAHGRSLFIPDSDDPAVVNILEERRRTGKYRGEMTFRHKDGSLIVVEISSVIFTNTQQEEQAVLSMRDITQRKKAEQEKIEEQKADQEQKEILQTIIDNIPVMIAFFDSQGQFKFVNCEWEKVIGYTLEECQSNPDIISVFYPDPEYRAQAMEFMLTAPPHWREFQLHVRGGNVLDTSWRNVRLSNATMIAIGQDITDRKRSEEAAERYIKRLNILNQLQRAIIEVTDAATLAKNTLVQMRKLMSAERASLVLFDLENSQFEFFAVDSDNPAIAPVSTRHTLDLTTLEKQRREGVTVTPDLRAVPNPNPAMQALIADGFQGQISVLLQSRDELIGALVLSLKRTPVLEADDERLLRDVGAQLSIALNQLRLTETVQNYARGLEDKVAQRTSALEGLINALPDYIFVIEKEAMYISFCNERFAQVIGFQDRLAVQGKTIHECFSPDLAAYFQQQNEVVFRTGETLHVEETLDLADGTRHLETFKIPVRDSKGDIYALIGTSHDLTDLLNLQHMFAEATEELSQSEARYRAVVETQNDLICRFLPDTTLTFVNSAYANHFGKTSEALIGQPFVNLLKEDYREPNRLHILSLVDNPRLEYYETKVADADGKARWHRWYNVPLLADDGTVIEFQGVGVDITERREAEEAVRHLNQQLEAANKELEAFSYSVSHDLRAPLRAIDGFSQVMIEQYSQRIDKEGQHYLQRIRDNALRMGELIDDLLALSRLGRQNLRKRQVQPAQLISEILNDWGDERPNPKAKVIVQEDMPPASADAGLLRQVYCNLLHNALKYSQYVNEPVIEVGYNRKGSEIVYFVKDNGAGFDMRYVGKLFGVFQRLHSPRDYEGTGIGLAIVQRIINRHGGRIWAEAQVNQGAAFYFALGEESIDVS